MYERIQASVRTSAARQARATTPLATGARAPATCGELVQGALDGRDFLVNCPIDLYSTAVIAAGRGEGLQLLSPGAWSKAAIAISRCALAQGLSLHETLAIDSPVPRGKGMASSTADISAALSAFCLHRGIELDATAFGALIASVEPSDCVHYAGIAEVDHLSGALFALWPVPRCLRVKVFDCGGSVDTVGFDRERARAVYAERRQDVQRFLGRVRCGLMSGDLAAIGAAATESARTSQLILAKPQLEELIALARSLGACGVNCAHSGTVLGVLYPDSPWLDETLAAAVADAFGTDLTLLGDHLIVGGGCHAIH